MIKDYAQKLKDAVEKAGTIVIGRHIQPDPDAFGSQLGMAGWIKETWPEKTVLCAGAGEGMDEISEEMIKDPDTMIIITDTSTAPRVDDQRLLENDNIWRIDHHVNVEPYSPKDKELVVTEAAASCELAALILKALDVNISKDTAQKLMEGLMADTQRLTIGSVTPKTMEAAGWLLKQNAKPADAAYVLYSKSWQDFQYKARVCSKAVLKNRFLYSLMTSADYLPLGLNFAKAKDHVDDLQGVLGVEIWLLLTEMETPGQYSASVRSRRIPVRDIAQSFGGGGHNCACGIRPLGAAQCLDLMDQLAKRSLETDFRISE